MSQRSSDTPPFPYPRFPLTTDGHIDLQLLRQSPYSYPYLFSGSSPMEHHPWSSHGISSPNPTYSSLSSSSLYLSTASPVRVATGFCPHWNGSASVELRKRQMVNLETYFSQMSWHHTPRSWVTSSSQPACFSLLDLHPPISQIAAVEDSTWYRW